MSLDPGITPKTFKEQINDLIDEKLQKFKMELSDSIEKLLEGMSIEPVAETSKLCSDLPPELIVQVCSFLDRASIEQLKLTNKRNYQVVERFSLDKIDFDKITLRLFERFHKNIYVFGSYHEDGIEHSSAINFRIDEGQIYLEFFREAYQILLSLIHSAKEIEIRMIVTKETMEVVRAAVAPWRKCMNIKINVYYYDDCREPHWDWFTLSPEDFLDLCSSVNSLNIHCGFLPRNYLNDEFMLKIIAMDHVKLTVNNLHHWDTYETGLTDTVLKALIDRPTIRQNFCVRFYKNMFTIRCIRKLIQKCVLDDCKQLSWDLGILKKKEMTHALLLTQEINENPQHPYEIHETHCCCSTVGKPYKVVNRETPDSNSFEIIFVIGESH